MRIDHLRIKDFRNYESAELQFGDAINVIQGHNGQGKTSILEAIYYLCLSKSFKTQEDATAVRFDAPYFDVEGTFFRDKSSLENGVRVILHRTEGKSVLIDKKRLDRFSELIGKFPAVISAPEDVQIVSGSPGYRRRWMDMALSQMQAMYLKDLQDYRQTLKQRNALLGSLVVRPDNLDAWDKELILTGSKIIRRRLEFVPSFAGLVGQVYRKIAADDESVEIHYRSSIADATTVRSWLETTDQTESAIRQCFSEQLHHGRAREIQRQISLYGPHKDELLFLLNGKNIRDYGSQGQFKTFAIALKLAEFFFMKERMEQEPLLLLDDVFSELDWDRRKHLMHYLETAGQVFITNADRDMPFDVKKEIKHFTVENAKVHTRVLV
jgi:DNA replication and repair protein RecF